MNIVLRQRFRAITIELGDRFVTDGGGNRTEGEFDFLRIYRGGRFNVHSEVRTTDRITEAQRGIAHIGRVQRLKGVYELAAAGERLGQQIEFFGSGEDLDDLRRRYPSHLWHGHTDRAVIGQRLQRMRAVVVASQSPEPFCMAGFESIATGLPLVLSDAILAAPVDTEELVTGEVLWIALRAAVFGCVPLLIAMLFGLDPAWGMLLTPLICFVAGFGWAAFGTLIAAIMDSIDNFNYITSIVLTPLFLVAGTFFPISGLPDWAQVLANVNPLYHCVQLVRDAAHGDAGPPRLRLARSGSTTSARGSESPARRSGRRPRPPRRPQRCDADGVRAVRRRPAPRRSAFQRQGLQRWALR